MKEKKIQCYHNPILIINSILRKLIQKKKKEGTQINGGNKNITNK